MFKDTPTRFKLYRFTEKHREIASFLGKGMTIPKSGAQKARKVVESLSSVVTVLSDLEGTAEAETREADSRPHAHILPCHEGIQVEFLVKPCGAAGSSFRAGRGSKNVLTELEGKRSRPSVILQKRKTAHSHNQGLPDPDPHPTYG